ncbi:hypothetical protein AAE478_007445 [Parahypoxylon ruwenzoriense]
MSPQNSSPEAHGVQESSRSSDKHMDTKSQAISTQNDLVEPLEDSQETNQNGSSEHSTFEQQSIQDPPSMRFTRPPIETPEEVMAGFQYQKPQAPRNMFNSSRGQQRTSILASMYNGQKASQHGHDTESSRVDNIGGQGKHLPPTNYKHEMRELMDNYQDNDTVNAKVNFDKAPEDAIQNNPFQDANVPGLIPDDDTSSFPFPDAIDLPHSSRRKQQHTSSSPLAKAQLPKSITDTRQRALAQISPQRRLAVAKASRLPSAKSQCQSAQVLGIADGEAFHKNREHSIDCKSRRREASRDLYNSEVERIPKGHQSQAGQQRRSLTRPIHLEFPEHEPLLTARPCSQTSNISKPRAPAKFHRQQISPTRRQNQINLEKFAKSWNTNYLYNQELLDRWEKKIEMLEKQILTQNLAIEQYQTDIESRDQTVDALSGELEEIRNQNQRAEDQIAASSAIRKKLEEKVRSCRARLNDAINEQQRLFLHSKETCQKTIEDIRVEMQEQKRSSEKALEISELARAEIQRKVATAVEDTERRVEELNKTVESFKIRLEEREKELRREREQAEHLKERLAQSYKSNEQSLQSVATRNLELLERIEQDRKQVENTEIFIHHQDGKIDTILKTLKEVGLKTIEPLALLENLKEIQNDIATTIVAEVKGSVESSQNPILKGSETMNQNIDSIRALCEGISERMTNVEEVAQWQGRSHDSDMVVQAQAQQIQELQDELHQAYVCMDEQSVAHQQLEGRLADLQSVEHNEQTANEKVKDLMKQVVQLQTILNEKDSIIAQSHEDLEVTQEELANQTLQLHDKEEQIQNERLKHEEAIELNAHKHNQEILHAVAEEAEKHDGRHRDTDHQLQEAGIVCTQLEQELAKYRQIAETSRKANVDEDFGQIRDELAMALASVRNLTSDLTESENVRDILRENLEEWSGDRVEIERMQQILGRLAKDQLNTIQMSDQLKELLEIQKKLSDTLEYHQAHLATAEAVVTIKRSPCTSGTITRSGWNPSSSPPDTVAHLPEKLQDLKRKVVVQSPAPSEDARVSPMSIEDERRNRRHLVPEKGIMKRLTRSASKESKMRENTHSVDSQTPMAPQQPPPGRRVARRGSNTTLITYSMYNRPVAGSVIATGNEGIDESQANSNGCKHETDRGYSASGEGNSEGTANPIRQTDDDDGIDESPTKRRRILDPN